MYKDINKQREAVGEAVRRFRAKGITKVEGITPNVIPDVIPKQSHCSMMVGYVPRGTLVPPES